MPMMKTLLTIIILWSKIASAGQSVCFGTTALGSLEHGVQLPAAGENFTGYSMLGRLLGRTYVHSAVRDIMLDAYQSLSTSHPDKLFKYAETGFAAGGEFKPHKTHRNGLSVDFMVPVTNQEGKSVHLPTHPFNKFGYNIEFDADSRYEDFTIDYEALAAHIVALHKAAVLKGYSLARVILAPEYQPNLYNTKFADYLKANIVFSTRRAWVRHDEHYHVDFAIPCNAN